MTEASRLGYPYNLLWWWADSRPAADAASGGVPSPGFVQPILPGWSFGGVTINEMNSHAPETEQRIVAEKSYGQQIGILLDGLAALAGDPGREKPETTKALAEVQALEKRVSAIKAEAAEARIERMIADLDALRRRPESEAYRAVAARLAAYLALHPPAAGA